MILSAGSGMDVSSVSGLAAYFREGTYYAGIFSG